MMKANIEKKWLGELDFYTNIKTYNIDAFKNDFKDYVDYSRLLSKKRDLEKKSKLEQKKIELSNNEKKQMKETRQGHDNFLGICIISGQRYFVNNLDVIRNYDDTKSILSFGKTYTTQNLEYKNKTKTYYSTPDSTSFVLAVLSDMERIEEQVNLTESVNGWINFIFVQECKEFLKRKLSSTLLFEDNLLIRVKNIVRKQYSDIPKLEPMIISMGIEFKEIIDNKNPVAFCLVKSDFDTEIPNEHIDFSEESHISYILEINQILSNYKIKKLPLSEKSKAKKVEDQIHAARRGMIFDNPTLLRIMLDCCFALGEVSYSALYTSFKQKLSNHELFEFSSFEQLDFESKIEKFEETNENNIPLKIGNTTEENDLIESSIENFIEDEEVYTAIDNTYEDLPENLEIYEGDTVSLNIEENSINDSEEYSDGEPTESLQESESLLEQNYYLKDLDNELRNKLENLVNEFPNLYEDLEIFIICTKEILNETIQKNAHDPKKVSQSYLRNLSELENLQFSRGQRYFEKLKEQLIYEKKLEKENSEISLMFTIHKIYKGKI